MSAITGPRSPTSPWSQESQALALPGPSSPAAFFSLCDPRPSSYDNISPRGTAAERAGTNYFSINVESPKDFIRDIENFSQVQSSIQSPKAQLIPGKNFARDHVLPSRAGSEADRVIPDSGLYTLSWNRAAEKREPSSEGLNRVTADTVETIAKPVSVERCAELLQSSQSDLMLLDVRPYTHFSKGSIKGSLNLCIPTTLLKRPSFDTKKLVNAFTDETDKTSFSRWRQCRHIVVYDAATYNMKDAAPLANMLKKFIAEGWDGEGLILMGGFNAFSARFPELTQRQRKESDTQSEKLRPMRIDLPGSTPISGGCSIPESSRAAIPFFGNIRQHMDLVGGVGQIALKHSEDLSESKRQSLPPWLREASDPADEGRSIAAKFLEIEKTELARMERALTYDSARDRPSTTTFRVAGIEKGTKNRYNNIYPYDHSRVRLQDVPPGGCDYINASYIKAEYSDRCYIATQAPVPETFNDFWRVVWEQDVRLVVSLTAEVESGQVKCDPYWKSGNYGPFQVNNFSHESIPIGSPSEEASTDNPGRPSIIVRHFGLAHSDFPFQPLREVTQLQYPYWPDFGTTSQPTHLLQLIEQCDKVRGAGINAASGVLRGNSMHQRPVMVHCSAGCGRTGTFCTVDSVLDMLKQQRAQGSGQRDSQSSSDRWIRDDHVDLIAKTVSDFRTQRPSMVQNLSQFVLCYESVLEWAVAQVTNVDNSQ